MSTSKMTTISPFSNYLNGKINYLKLPSVTPESFFYLAPSKLFKSEKPYLSRLPYSPEAKRSSIVAQNHTVSIHDLSGSESFFKLEDSGFEFAKCPIRVKQWSDASVLQYTVQLSEWLKQHLNCSRIFTYAYNVSQLCYDYKLDRC